MLGSIPLLPIWLLGFPLLLGIAELIRTPKPPDRGSPSRPAGAG